jgi:hypothetical protein
MRRGFIGGILAGSLLMLAAKKMMNNGAIKLPGGLIKQGKQMMGDMDMDEWMGRSRKVVRKTGRRIMRSMSR